MAKNIVFIHGMFLNPKSFDELARFFQALGYGTLVPAWPLHEGDPAALRANVPPGLGELKLETLIEHFDAIVRAQAEPPVILGHSLGGLIAQVLVNRGLGAAGVCLSSVAPNDMVALDWGFMRNSASITNPLKGNSVFEMTPEGFHKNFANTMSEAESNAAYEKFAVHESRNVLRNALGKAGHIDLKRAHVPLLFVGGEKDEIIPAKLNKKNSEAYEDPESIIDFQEFPDRGHFIYGQPGWQEIAQYIHRWLQENVS